MEQSIAKLQPRAAKHLSGKTLYLAGDLRDQINRRIEAKETQGQIAESLGVSVQTVNDVLHGRVRQEVSEGFAKAMGYRRVTVFVRE